MTFSFIKLYPRVIYHLVISYS